MTAEEIRDRLFTLLHGRFGIRQELLTPENGIRPLTGEVFRLAPYDMVALFMEVQQLFSVTIDMNDPCHTRRFDTVEHIAAIVAEQMAAGGR